MTSIEVDINKWEHAWTDKKDLATIAPYKFVQNIEKRSRKMAEEKYVVAAIRNKVGASGAMGTVIDNFRKIEFARHARGRLQSEAQKKGIRDLGIFQNGKFIKEL